MMKNLTFGALALIITFSAACQENDIKPNPGDWSAEVNFNPLGSSPISISGIRIRNFSDGGAFRVNVFLSHYSESPVEDLTRSYTEISIKPGWEDHFEGTDRLSPYYGGELEIAFKASKLKDTNPDFPFEMTGAWDTNGFHQGYTRLGANFIMGCDYYVARKLYLGTEVAFGFSYLKWSDLKSEDFQEDFKGGSTTQIGPNYNSSIRLGYIF